MVNVSLLPKLLPGNDFYLPEAVAGSGASEVELDLGNLLLRGLVAETQPARRA